MRTNNRLACWALAALLAGCGWLHASEPETAKASGRLLVLANERTIEGNVEKRGDQYCIRRPVGELWVPAANVLFLCDGTREAYQFLYSRANARDPDERLRLARWCQSHGLKKEAVDEAAAAVQLRPEHKESRRLLAALQHNLAPRPSAAVSKPHEELDTGAVLPGVDRESLSAFVTRVQPILMNACASCHAGGHGGNFKLMRTFNTGAAGRKITLQNLASVLVYLNNDKPQASIFLTNAASMHGGGEMLQPPLGGRDSPAYRSLEEWVRNTLDANPQLHAPSAAAAATPNTLESSVNSPVVAGPEPATPKQPAASPGPKSAKAAEESLAQPRPPVRAPSQFATSKKEEPHGYPEPVDVFDPVIFNRQMHPKPDSLRQ